MRQRGGCTERTAADSTAARNRRDGVRAVVVVRALPALDHDRVVADEAGLDFVLPDSRRFFFRSSSSVSFLPPRTAAPACASAAAARSRPRAAGARLDRRSASAPPIARPRGRARLRVRVSGAHGDQQCRYDSCLHGRSFSPECSHVRGRPRPGSIQMRWDDPGAR